MRSSSNYLLYTYFPWARGLLCLIDPPSLSLRVAGWLAGWLSSERILQEQIPRAIGRLLPLPGGLRQSPVRKGGFRISSPKASASRLREHPEHPGPVPAIEARPVASSHADRPAALSRPVLQQFLPTPSRRTLPPCCRPGAPSQPSRLPGRQASLPFSKTLSRRDSSSPRSSQSTCWLDKVHQAKPTPGPSELLLWTECPSSDPLHPCKKIK